jgi:uncharacterized protein (TIGR00369 family)
MDAKQAADRAMIEEGLRTLFAPWVDELALRVLDVQPSEVLLALPVAERFVHSGQVMCGQALMAAADTAMVLATMARLGAFKPMTTVQLQTSFLRPIPAGSPDVQLRASVLRLGRTLAFGEIEILGADGQLAAHATTSYAFV